MSQEKTDLKAAENEFLEIFDLVENNTRAETVKIFVRHFIKSRRIIFDEAARIESSNRDWYNFYLVDVQKKIKDAKGKSVLEQAKLLGGALGYYMAIVEKMMILNPYFSGKQWGDIVDSNNVIAELLNSTGKKIKKDYVKKWFKRLVKKYGSNLSDRNKKLLAKMAAKI